VYALWFCHSATVERSIHKVRQLRRRGMGLHPIVREEGLNSGESEHLHRPVHIVSAFVCERNERMVRTSANCWACSITTTEWPRRASAIDVARPPRPAPTITILRQTLACRGLAFKLERFCTLGEFRSFRRKFRTLDGYGVVVSVSETSPGASTPPSLFGLFALISDFKQTTPLIRSILDRMYNFLSKYNS
jgi:hypothetical protein